MERALSMEDQPGPSPEGRPGLAGLVGELPRVRALLARLLRRAGQGADADDLTQEVALRALRYGQNFDPLRPLVGWVKNSAPK